MKISLEWLQDFVEFTETDPARIATVLTEKTAEIEAVLRSSDQYKTVVTGKLLEFEKVSGSDKLHRGVFDLGEQGTKEVIFGKVFELQVGEIYPIALGGTVLPSGVTVKDTKIMGVKTEGMVCSEAELNFHFTKEGLLRFPGNTSLGLPIMEVLETALQNVVIGEILEITKHPNADKLKLTKIRVSPTEVLEIVCGGSNLQVGAKVSIALVGANLWGEIPIKKAKLREVESCGMICSTEELKVAPSQNKEIYLLPNDAPVGKSFLEYVIGVDTVLDIENPALTNRPDLFSHIGFAHEIAACDLGKLKKLELPKAPKVSAELPIQITVPKDPEICQRYMAVAVDGVDGMRASPEWLQKRLQSCGIRPISALVDITNYVMLEYGVPMHAFDRDRTGKNWNMRLAKDGETMVTLDGVTRKLTAETIVFESEKDGIFDLCGIMGGENSGIRETTKELLLHAMSYDPVKIRRTALKVGPRTDAAAIFEKNVPVMMVEGALLRALELLLEIFPEAKVVSKIMDQKNIDVELLPIDLPLKLIERIMGQKIPPTEIIRILTSLGCSVKEQKDEVLAVTPPGWRTKDLNIPEDLAEEVVRMYGLNHIEASPPEMSMRHTPQNPRRKLEQEIAHILVQNGCYEILTLAFLGKELLTRCKLTDDESSIRLANPLSEDMSIMRPSLTPRLLEIAEKNIRARSNFRLFESGNVYHLENREKREISRITVLLVGDDFLGAKAIAEELMHTQDWQGRLSVWENPPAFLHPARHAIFCIGKSGRIKIAEIHPEVSANFGLPKNTSLLCMDLLPLAEMEGGAKKILSLPKYQEIPFDFSVLCAEKIPVGNLIKDLEELDARIYSMEIMEAWSGKGVPKGQKSVTISCEFRAPDHTLTESERDEILRKILAELEKRGAKLRFGE